MRAVIKNIFMFFYGYLSFAFPYSFCAREMTKYYNKMAEQENKKKKGKTQPVLMRLNNELNKQYKKVTTGGDWLAAR